MSKKRKSKLVPRVHRTSSTAALAGWRGPKALTVCGLLLTLVLSYGETWNGVTCKRCLRAKPKRGKRTG